ncbi:hypothetical protein U1Q18_038803 [Sarracenia purpurea var. burkii]
MKEAKESVIAAKHKMKQLKQKMQDEVAKAIIATNGAPLSVSEHKAIVLQIKAEAAQAHAEMLESRGVVTNGMFLVALCISLDFGLTPVITSIFLSRFHDVVWKVYGLQPLPPFIGMSPLWGTLWRQLLSTVGKIVEQPQHSGSTTVADGAGDFKKKRKKLKGKRAVVTLFERVHVLLERVLDCIKNLKEPIRTL